MTRSVTRAALAVAAFQAVSLCAAQDVQVNVDGQALTFPDTQPQLMYSDNVMIPVRPVLEHMGGEVHWDSATKTVTANVKGKEIEFKIYEPVATVDGKYLDLQNAPVMVNGRTVIPMRFLVDAFGAQVNWSETDKMLSIDTDGAIAEENLAPAPSQALTLYEGQTIPVILDSPLDSNNSQEGDVFTATVNGTDEFAVIPVGTKVEGHVVAVHPMIGDQAGSLELAFDRMIFPNGETLAIDGSLLSAYNDPLPADQSGPYDTTLETGQMIEMRINRGATIYLSE
jgi:hypothetical protein